MLRGLGLKSYDDIDLLYRQFYTGMDRNLTTKELDTILSLATSEVNLNKYLHFDSINVQYHLIQSNSKFIPQRVSSF